MTTSAELELDVVPVAPGGEAATTLTVRNDSDIVEAYGFEVVGPCAPWTTVEPERLSLYPGTSETVTVRLRPPRSPQVRAGDVPLAVRVRPEQRPDLASVPETTVRIGPFGELEAALVPVRRRTWRGARFRAEVTDQGNTPVSVVAVPADPTEELRFRGGRAPVPLDPAERGEVRFTARTRKLLWFGKSRTFPFLVSVSPEPVGDEVPGPPRELRGEVVQLPILPRWLLALLALLLALLLAWFTLVRPAVRSAAKEAAENQANDMVAAGQLQPGPANGGVRPTPATPPEAGGGGGGGGSGGIAGEGNPEQNSQTIEVTTAGGARETGSYTVPPGRMFQVTDLVVANFQGDEGLITIVFGDRVITTIALETYRNQDYHWVTPIEVPEGATVRAEVACARPGTPASGQQAPNCLEVLNVSGELRDMPQG